MAKYTTYLFTFFLIAIANYCSASRDTSIFTFWKNGKIKTQTIYKVKYKKGASNDIVFKLNKKKTKYFDRTGTKISKRDFNYFYKPYVDVDSSNYFDFDALENSITRKIDSLQNKFRNLDGINLSFVTLYLSDSISHNLFPLKIPIRNTEARTYIEKDTVIAGKKYSIQIITIDTSIVHVYRSATKRLLGAIRVDKSKVYYYDGLNNTEKLTVDFAPLAHGMSEKLAKGTVTVFGAYTELATAAKKEIRSGPEILR